MAAQLKVIGSGLDSLKVQNSGTDRQKALEAALAQIDRAFGKGSAMKLGSREKIEIETIPTGSLGLDIALGVGGLPRGRVIEIYGPESSGKTTLALHAIAEAQRRGGTAAFVDAEHALDPGTVAATHDEASFTARGIDPGTVASTHEEMSFTSRGIESTPPAATATASDAPTWDLPTIDPTMVAGIVAALGAFGFAILGASFVTRRREPGAV